MGGYVELDALDENYGVSYCSKFLVYTVHRMLFVCSVFIFGFPFGFYVELNMLCMIGVLANTIMVYRSYYAPHGIYTLQSSTVL